MALANQLILPLPLPPDFLLCDQVYGLDLSNIDCQDAIDSNFAAGSLPFSFIEGLPGPRSTFLSSVSHGGCTISVKLAGHSIAPRTLTIIPDHLQNLATSIVQQCVTMRGGIGGFGTMGLRGLRDYIGTDRFISQEQLTSPWPATTAFLTVTVSNRNSRDTNPGDTDPTVPITLAQGQGVHPFIVRALIRIGQYLQRGGTRSWWNTFPEVWDARVATRYQCDADLGSPKTSDCAQIEWNQLGAGKSAADTVRVSPETPTFLHSNMCYLAISAATSIVLTWAQIRTAVSTLMNVCVENPLKAAQGGKAYYTASPAPPIHGRGGKKRRAQVDGGLNGLNALPPSVNVTIFEQRERWADAQAEMRSCTWQAVEKGLPVARCGLG